MRVASEKTALKSEGVNNLNALGNECVLTTHYKSARLARNS